MVNEIIEEAEKVGEHALEGLRAEAEKVVDTVFGAGTAANGEAAVERVAMSAAVAGGTAVAALAALGEGHVHIAGLDLTAELTAAKTKVEEAIVALARHISGAA